MILQSLAVLGGLTLAFALVIYVASRRLAVREDPLTAKLEALLPGTNCGACGFAGCRFVAELMAQGKAPPEICVAGGREIAEQIAALLGVETKKTEPLVAVIHCQGGTDRAKERFTYHGVARCSTAQLTAGGHKACDYGCLGLGDCVRACPFNAITMGKDALPVINRERCVACGKCVAACPRQIISLIPRSRKVYLGCVSHDRGRAVKNVCSVGCIACGICAKVTPNEAIKMRDNLPEIDIAAGNNFDEAVKRCPAKCFVVVKET